MDKKHETEQQTAPRPESQDPPVESRPSAGRRHKLVAGIIIAVVVLFGAGFAGARVYEMTAVNQNGLAARPTIQNDGNKVITKNEENIAGVVSKVSPSVVSVLTKLKSPSDYGSTTTQQEGAGTGIIIGKDGYILTNKHVIKGASTVSVVLADGTSYDNVKVVGSDPLNDIAVLKIPNVNNLPVAELGDSSSVRVGQSVVAIGNSLGQYQNTVTSGIISGTGRPISAQAGGSIQNLTDLLQTDAAINPGNSGGPLLNLQGQVIGINTAIIQDAQGIGFAIPINATKGILKSVLAGGPLQRAYVGLNYTSITPDSAKYYKLPVKEGAYVFSGSSNSAVIPGSPADKAGIQEKDIITKVNGVSIGSQGDLSTLVAEYAPGDTIELSILRGGQTLTVKVTLEAYKA